MLSRPVALALVAACVVLGVPLGWLGMQAVEAQPWSSSASRAATTPAPTASLSGAPPGRCMGVGGLEQHPAEGQWDYGRKIEQADFARLRAAGITSVRIPFNAEMRADAAGRVDPAFLARIEQVTGWALDAGLTPVLAYFADEKLHSDPDIHEPRTLAVWRSLAARWANLPPQVMFEAVNEPHEATNGARGDLLNARILAEIRRTNPTRTVVLNPGRWANVQGLQEMRLPADPNLVVAVHYYSPWPFTHQGADWNPNAPAVGSQHWPTPEGVRELEADMAAIRAWRDRTGVPVWIGEFGTHPKISVEQRAAWTRDVRMAFETAGLPWCYFSYTPSFQVWDYQTRRWIGPIFTALTGEAPPD
jgi:endoglucanase